MLRLRKLLTEEVRLDVYKKSLNDLLNYRIKEDKPKIIGICILAYHHLNKAGLVNYPILMADIVDLFPELTSRKPDITIGGFWFAPEEIEPRITLLLEIIQELEQKLQSELPTHTL